MVRPRAERTCFETDKGEIAMITFEEFSDAYSNAVPKILAKMKYLERIGRDPFDGNKPLPKWWHKMNNLKERRKQNRSNKIPF